MSKSFDDLLALVKKCPKKKVSVAVAQDNEVLLAVKAAKEQGISKRQWLRDLYYSKN